MIQRLVVTEDGSTSIFIEELDEHYHSIHGAMQESMHVFIEAGFRHKLNQLVQINILEIGFGTGLNALLTCLEAIGPHQKIFYTGIEKFPLSKEIQEQLNYCTLIDHPLCSERFNSMHSSVWGTSYSVSAQFSLLKLNMDIQEISFDNQFDIIYFDAFAPSAQPELWTQDIFNAMYGALKNGGILVTYCAKGEVKRRMKHAGFTVEALPGPKGKREMTRASKI
jgi:tRNA U34 5-methylaminomethyl-2-thiouridine-forming methyltransferase MnmC